MIGEADAAGRGLAREATDAVVALAFDQLGLQEVYLEVIPEQRAGDQGLRGLRIRSHRQYGKSREDEQAGRIPA